MTGGTISHQPSAIFFVAFNLPCRGRLRAGTDVGDVGIDPAGMSRRTVFLGRLFGPPRRLVFLFRDAGLFPLTFRDGRPRSLCHIDPYALARSRARLAEEVGDSRPGTTRAGNGRAELLKA